jgi:hypothetical protein
VPVGAGITKWVSGDGVTVRPALWTRAVFAGDGLQHNRIDPQNTPCHIPSIRRRRARTSAWTSLICTSSAEQPCTFQLEIDMAEARACAVVSGDHRSTRTRYLE